MKRQMARDLKHRSKKEGVVDPFAFTTIGHCQFKKANDGGNSFIVTVPRRNHFNYLIIDGSSIWEYTSKDLIWPFVMEKFYPASGCVHRGVIVGLRGLVQRCFQQKLEKIEK